MSNRGIHGIEEQRSSTDGLQLAYVCTVAAVMPLCDYVRYAIDYLFDPIRCDPRCSRSQARVTTIPIYVSHLHTRLSQPSLSLSRSSYSNPVSRHVQQNIQPRPTCRPSMDISPHIIRTQPPLTTHERQGLDVQHIQSHQSALYSSRATSGGRHDPFVSNADAGWNMGHPLDHSHERYAAFIHYS